MSATAGTMRVPGRKANVMPTASASMLVAIASRSMVLNASEPSELILVLGQRLADHIAANDAQQHERDPVIDRGDKLFKL